MQELARLTELKAKWQERIKADLKKNIEAEEEENRELRAQLEALRAEFLDSDTSDQLHFASRS
jgi:hypothetical protein